MEFEFDKEMDALLRQATRSGETRVSEVSGSHIDADEISIFAENALGEKAKLRVISHLADCDRCRTILSNTILLNSEAGENAVPIAASGEEKVAASVLGVPWYKKLFATRNLSYGLGALVIVFAGMFGFLIVQRSLNSGAMDMAKVSDDATNPARSSSSAESAPGTAAANSNTAPGSNDENLSESKNDSNTATDSADNAGDMPGGPRTREIGADKENDSDGYAERRKENTFGSVSGGKNKVGNRPDENQNADRSQESESNLNDKDDSAGDPRDRDVLASRSAPAAPPKPAQAQVVKPSPRAAGQGQTAKKYEEKARTNTAAETVATDELKEADSRSIGGKNFTLKDRVWYDSQYNGQKTTNVRRRAKEYMKLDSGLRSITDKFTETVVIVWKSKAYRIS